MKRRCDDAAAALSLLIIAGENDIGAKLIDGLSDNAAAVEDFDCGFHFVLAIGLLECQRLAGGGDRVEADAFAPEAKEDSRFAAIRARSEQEDQSAQHQRYERYADENLFMALELFP